MTPTPVVSMSSLGSTAEILPAIARRRAVPFPAPTGAAVAEWEIDLSEVNGLRQWYKRQPKMMQRASALLLNRFAWGTRDEAVRQIGRVMTVRNKRFVDSRLRVTQASQSTPIGQQRSIAGSLATARFSGWTEQEVGTPTERKRVSTLASRSGDFSRQMIPRSRLKPGTTVESLEKAVGSRLPRGGATNYAGMIAMLGRERYKGLLRIKGGFYLVDRGGRRIEGPTRNGRGKLTTLPHLTMVQAMKKKQPKQHHWLRQARAIYFRKNDPQVTWGRVVDRLIHPPPKR